MRDSKSMQDWPKTIVFSSFPFLSFGRTSITVTARENSGRKVRVTKCQICMYNNVILCKQIQKGKSLVYIMYLNSTKWPQYPNHIKSVTCCCRISWQATSYGKFANLDTTNMRNFQRADKASDWLITNVGVIKRLQGRLAIDYYQIKQIHVLTYYRLIWYRIQRRSIFKSTIKWCIKIILCALGFSVGFNFGRFSEQTSSKLESYHGV